MLLSRRVVVKTEVVLV